MAIVQRLEQAQGITFIVQLGLTRKFASTSL